MWGLKSCTSSVVQKCQKSGVKKPPLCWTPVLNLHGILTRRREIRILSGTGAAVIRVYDDNVSIFKFLRYFVILRLVTRLRSAALCTTLSCASYLWGLTCRRFSAFYFICARRSIYLLDQWIFAIPFDSEWDQSNQFLKSVILCCLCILGMHLLSRAWCCDHMFGTVSL